MNETEEIITLSWKRSMKYIHKFTPNLPDNAAEIGIWWYFIWRMQPLKFE